MTGLAEPEVEAVAAVSVEVLVQLVVVSVPELELAQQPELAMVLGQVFGLLERM